MNLRWMLRKKVERKRDGENTVCVREEEGGVRTQSLTAALKLVHKKE